MPQTTVAAIDLGATSGRVIIGNYSDRGLELAEVYRFPNAFNKLNNNCYWDVGTLFEQVRQGLRKAIELYPELSCCGVDTWGVDLVLTDDDGRMVFPCHAYRDQRTNPLMEEVRAKGDARKLFDLTGIPLVNYNTSFQLAELIRTYPALPDIASHAQLLPHYFTGLLCGQHVSEFSMASTTQLLSISETGYSTEALDYFNIPQHWLTAPRAAGCRLGKVRDIPGLEKVEVTLVPGHDTSCAFEAIPRTGNSLIISSGTWLLAGAVTEGPCLGDAAFKLGISNERTGDGGYRPNKILLGLWLLEQTIPYFDKRPNNDAEWNALISAAEESPMPPVLLDTTDTALFNPPNMREAIDTQLRQRGGTLPPDLPGYFKLICASLGHSVARTSDTFEQILGKTFDNIIIVGGGAKNRLLCRMIAEATGKPVTSFNIEATSVGNMAYQLLAMGKIQSLSDFHQVLRPNLNERTFNP